MVCLGQTLLSIMYHDLVTVFTNVFNVHYLCVALSKVSSPREKCIYRHFIMP